MLKGARWVIHQREFGILLALILITIVISIVEPKFLSKTNIFTVLKQVSFVAIMALGVFFVIITSGIDLSVGSVFALSGVVCGLAMAAGLHPVLAILAGLLTGAGLGLVNGVIVSYIGVTPFIVTLGMLSMARGGVLVITGGRAIDSAEIVAFGEAFKALREKFLFGLSPAVVGLIIVAVIAHLLLKYTVFGRRVYAIGGNEEATRLSGINVKLVKLSVYVISGLYAATASVLYVGKLGSAQAKVGEGQELNAIAAAVIGGTSLLGGEGSVVGVLIGAMIMGVVTSGMTMMDIEDTWQKGVLGFIIVLAAIIDVIRRRRAA
jgi:ribose transport system permease protein